MGPFSIFKFNLKWFIVFWRSSFKMATEITIAHNVQRRFKAGQFCGSETEIVITLPQKDYQRLTRSLGWRSVHWPAKRRGRPGKLPIKPVENCSPRPRGRPRKIRVPKRGLPAEAVVPCEPISLDAPRPGRHLTRPPRVPRPRGRPRATPEPRPPAEAVEVRDPLTLPPSLAGGPEDMFMALPITHTDPFVPALTSAVRVQAAPPTKPRRRPRAPERDRFVEPDVPYVLQTLREMLAVAEQKEAYHAAALRAVQGPRVTQKRRAFAILPLLRKTCIRPLQKAIRELEKKLESQQ